MNVGKCVYLCGYEHSQDKEDFHYPWSFPCAPLPVMFSDLLFENIYYCAFSIDFIEMGH